MNVIAAKKKGFRVLAGPFDPTSRKESQLSEGIVAFLKATGGRVVSVDAPYDEGFFLYRPVLEMETIQQTERRLYAAKLRKQPNPKTQN